jgi:hypothetical protein
MAVTLPSDAPGGQVERRATQIRQAIAWAHLAYPGPVGEYLARELDTAYDLSKSLGSSDALIWRVVADIRERAKGKT